MKPRKLDKLEKYLERNGISQEEFGRRLGVTQGAVWQWIEGRAKVSHKHFDAIEEHTDGEVTREYCRPDVFGEARAA